MIAPTKASEIWEAEHKKQYPTGYCFLYKENHALDAWFDKAYGDE